VGTTGLAMLDLLRDYEHLIVIDAAQDTGHPAGTVVVYTPEDLAKHQVLHTAHDMRFSDVLKSAALMGVELESVVIVAVQVAAISPWVLELSEELEAAIPIACACALQRLQDLGGGFSPKPDAEIPDELDDALANYALENTD
jgi:hydrogenase maturation protease